MFSLKSKLASVKSVFFLFHQGLPNEIGFFVFHQCNLRNLRIQFNEPMRLNPHVTAGQKTIMEAESLIQ
jgi:hypothetical protein